MSEWPKVPLEEVCSLVTDGTHHSPPNFPEGPFRYVTAKNIRPWGLDLSDMSYVDTATHAEIYSRCPVEYGDVLYIKDGVTTGLAAINSLSEPFSMLSSVALLKPIRTALNPLYLKHWLNSPTARRDMTSGMTGTAIKRLVLKQIRTAEIPLAPLAEQARIADKLDTVLARVDAVNTRLARVAPLLKRFRQSVLAAATSGRLTDDWRDAGQTTAAWSQTTVGAIAIDLRYGTSKKCSVEPIGSAVLRIPNIGSDGGPELSDLKYAEFDVAERAKLALRVGDLLIIRSNGSVDLVGKCCVVDEQAADMMFAGYLMRLRLATSRADPKFTCLALSSPALRALIERTAKSTSGVNNINSEELRSLPLHLPPLEEQAEIVRRVDTLFAFADRLEARLQAAQTAATRLIPALLAKAFRGELVPQDPADEPATELLRRLAEQRAQAAPARPRRGRAGA